MKHVVQQTITPIVIMTGSMLIFSGIAYGLVQFIHPLDTVANTTTTQWGIVHTLSLCMDAAAIIGLLGLILILKNRIGWVAKAGMSLYITFWFLIFGFHFAEAFIIPTIAQITPEFVTTWQGLITGVHGQFNLGLIPLVYTIAGLLYIIGGAITGASLIKSQIVGRAPGVILLAGSLLTVLGAVIPHPADRIMALPIAVAFVCIGVTLIKNSKRSA